MSPDEKTSKIKHPFINCYQLLVRYLVVFIHKSLISLKVLENLREETTRQHEKFRNESVAKELGFSQSVTTTTTPTRTVLRGVISNDGEKYFYRKNYTSRSNQIPLPNRKISFRFHRLQWKNTFRNHKPTQSNFPKEKLILDTPKKKTKPHFFIKCVVFFAFFTQVFKCQGTFG